MSKLDLTMNSDFEFYCTYCGGYFPVESYDYIIIYQDIKKHLFWFHDQVVEVLLCKNTDTIMVTSLIMYQSKNPILKAINAQLMINDKQLFKKPKAV